MVQAMISISDHANHVLNIVKAKYSLRDKSQAIEVMATEYEQELLEPPFKPGFVKDVLQASKSGRFRRVKNVRELLK